MIKKKVYDAPCEGDVTSTGSVTGMTNSVTGATCSVTGISTSSITGMISPVICMHRARDCSVTPQRAGVYAQTMCINVIIIIFGKVYIKNRPARSTSGKPGRRYGSRAFKKKTET